MKKSTLNLALLTASLLLPNLLLAHCDTMDGPVVSDARTALDKKDVTPVLKWVTKQDEPEITRAFSKTLKVPTKDQQARQAAELSFFQTLVRVHRASEGAPYTGLKPAGSETSPLVAAADKALSTGSLQELSKLVPAEKLPGLRQRFAEVRTRSKQAEDSVEAGRAFVAAYVDYIHYAEGVQHDEHSHKTHSDHPAAHNH